MRGSSRGTEREIHSTKCSYGKGRKVLVSNLNFCLKKLEKARRNRRNKIANTRLRIKEILKSRKAREKVNEAKIWFFIKNQYN